MVLNKNKYRLFIFNTIILFCGVYNIAFSQNLCTNPPANTEVGAFEIVGGVTSGCSPFNVQLNDISGGTDIRYDFFYTNKTVAQLDKTGNTAISNPYFANININSYTILQYGKKNGKDMYACKTITVRPNSQPKFSFNSCNSNFLNIIIPQDAANNFDYYTIDWGDSSPLLNVTQLPFTGNRSYSSSLPSRNVKVEGHFNTPNSCPGASYKSIDMAGDGDFPKITELETLPGGKSIKLSFTGAFDKHQIYQRAVNDTYTYPNFKLESNPGSIEMPLIGNQQNCFMIYRNPACIQVSGEVCTIKLDSITPTGIVGNRILFENHPNNTTSTILNSATIKNINYNLKIQQISGNSITNSSINTVSNGLIDNITDCKAKYCYQIVADVSGIWGSQPSVPYSSIVRSEIKCIQRSELKPSISENNYVNVNNGNKSEITYVDDNSWPVIKDWLYIYKKNNSNVYEKIDSLKNPFNKYIDKTSKAELVSECYKLSFKDQCESISEISKEFCSINLSSKDDKKISWTSQNPFESSIITQYNLISYDENTKAQLASTIIPKSENSFFPDFIGYEKEAEYRIMIENNIGIKSFSNNLTIPIKAEFFLPSAFSPNGDLLNDNFEIKGRFGRVVNMNLAIFDRWGTKLIELTDPLIPWDGTLNGEKVKNEIYSYKLNILLNNGEKIKKEGNFVLLR